MADLKDDMLAKIRKQVGRARLRPVDPLAGRSVAETLAPTAMDDRERWVFHLVSGIAISLRLHVRILVLQDSMEHYVVHFVQGKRLTTYRVDKAWVADAMAGKADQRERIHKAVEQYLRREFLGGQIAAKPVPAPAAAPAAGGTAATPKPAAAAAAPGSPGAASSAQPALSREEIIAAARAKADAIRAQRAAGGSPPPRPKDPAQS